jgi:hypothetical protein
MATRHCLLTLGLIVVASFAARLATLKIWGDWVNFKMDGIAFHPGPGSARHRSPAVANIGGFESLLCSAGSRNTCCRDFSAFWTHPTFHFVEDWLTMVVPDTRAKFAHLPLALNAGQFVIYTGHWSGSHL